MVAMVTLMTGVNVDSNEVMKPVPEENIEVFDFSDIYGRPGTYHRDAFLAYDNGYGIYRFDNTDVVVFHIFGDTYLVGEDTAWDGPSWMQIVQKDGEFLALSNKYMLFATKEGKVARELEEKRVEREDGIYLVHETVPYDELSEEDQKAFVYASEYEVVEKQIQVFDPKDPPCLL